MCAAGKALGMGRGREEVEERKRTFALINDDATRSPASIPRSFFTAFRLGRHARRGEVFGSTSANRTVRRELLDSGERGGKARVGSSTGV